MKKGEQRAERRDDALSKERIVEAAIDILDTEGEAALTFRALAARLNTGSGAIYWHVADKNALLAAATDRIFSSVTINLTSQTTPQEVIRSIALGVYDASEAHPWVGDQLAPRPGHSALLKIFEGIGSQLQSLGLRDATLFQSWSALVNFMLGVTGQNALHARLLPPNAERSAILGNVAHQWAKLEPEQYPFLRTIAPQLASHDDREQFKAGIDLILDGIESNAKSESSQ